MAQPTPRNASGLRSRELKAIRIAAGLKQAQLLVRLEAAGRQLGIEVAPRASLSGWCPGGRTAPL